jgi:hypothetical protein
MLITDRCYFLVIFVVIGRLRFLVYNDGVGHGSAEGAVPIAEVVIVLPFFEPLDFIRVAANLAFIHGFAPLV